MLQKRRQALGRILLLYLRIFPEGAVIDFLHRKDIAHRRHVAGDGAVAHGDQKIDPRPQLLNLVQVIFGADRPFHQGHINVVREGFEIDQRTVDDVDFIENVNQSFIHIQKRHVAAGAAVEPDSGEADFFFDFTHRVALASV